MNAQQTFYSELTDSLLKSMQTAGSDWLRPWVQRGAAKNAKTNGVYRGGNQLMLSLRSALLGYKSNQWLTYRQALELGGHVKAGEKSAAKVIFFSRFEKEKATGEKESFAVARAHSVFNVSQCEGIEIEEEKERNNVPRETIEAFVKTTGATIEVGRDIAAFIPSRDLVVMPSLGSFESSDAYYSTLFHELTHWTGAEKRLDRLKTCNKFDSRYAFEELVAELGSAFLGQRFGIPHTTRHAQYLNNWAEGLKENPVELIKRAASMAQKACDFLLKENVNEEKEAA